MKKSETAQIEYPLAAKAAVALAALLSLSGSFEYSGLESAYQQQFRDPYQITAQFSRFDSVQSAIPEKSTLGYLTDTVPGTVVGDAMFNGAQFVLAPRVLQKGAAFDVVLGNFTKPADFIALGRAQGLRLDRDFGNGVMLFRREAR
jgi:hypothetical protein